MTFEFGVRRKTDLGRNLAGGKRKDKSPETSREGISLAQESARTAQ